jgi:hypothetical protein
MSNDWAVGLPYYDSRIDVWAVVPRQPQNHSMEFVETKK